ncbi:unnamed protein product [Paramecium primaurelia]|uniref:Uncharacterized protein n=1 Tax=Paramecium primaurelia TaxID=5886 RepID=A0A8S1LUD3_PARPR|nr:unnamed protein product [Paramecium primaurelia]
MIKLQQYTIQLISQIYIKINLQFSSSHFSIKSYDKIYGFAIPKINYPLKKNALSKQLLN